MTNYSTKPTIEVSILSESIKLMIYKIRREMKNSGLPDDVIEKFTQDVCSVDSYESKIRTCLKYINVKDNDGAVIKPEYVN